MRRMLAGIRADVPPDVNVPLLFAPAEAAKVEFGAGQLLVDLARGEPRRTWCFVMRLCFSHRQSQVRDYTRLRPHPLVQRAYAECAEGCGFKIDPCPPADASPKIGSCA